MEASKSMADEVLQEFPAVGKYRIRLVKRPKKDAAVLDIREYVSSESFEGFTRRGITILSKTQAETLLTVLGEVLKGEALSA